MNITQNEINELSLGINSLEVLLRSLDQNLWHNNGDEYKTIFSVALGKIKYLTNLVKKLNKIEAFAELVTVEQYLKSIAGLIPHPQGSGWQKTSTGVWICSFAKPETNYPYQVWFLDEEQSIWCFRPWFEVDINNYKLTSLDHRLIDTLSDKKGIINYNI